LAPAQLAEYRRELFQFIYQRAADLGGRDAVLAEQAYASTLSHSGGRRLSKLSRRGVTLVLVMLLLLGVSEIAWLWQSWPVRQAVGAAQASARMASGGVAPC
jgi:type VI secretion system protein ImpK